MNNIRIRRIEERLAKGTCCIAAILASLIFIAILGKVFVSAIPALSITFLTQPESIVGVGAGGGIINAVIGTVVIALSATVLAVPLAIGTAIYLQKYATNKRLAGTFRFFLEILAGTPSIVLGIFGLLVLVFLLRPFTGGFSLISGAIALSILIMPVIERTIEEAISKIPRDLEEGSYALGATKWQTVRDIVIPVGMTGILTGTILGFGRAAEESAVVILTAGYSQFIPEIGARPNDNVIFGLKIYPFQDLIGTLPANVYNAYENQHLHPVANAFAAAFVLIMIVLTINLSAKIIIRRSFSQNSSTTSLSEIISQKLSFLTKTNRQIDPPSEKTIGVDHKMEKPSNQPKPSFADTIGNNPLIKKIGQLNLRSGKKRDPVQTPLSNDPGKRLALKSEVRPFLRALLPFTIPLAILVLVAVLAGVPPLNHILGSASPSLAGLFSTTLTSIIAVAGLAFGLFFARKRGAFRAKNRQASLTGVAVGFCLVIIAAVVFSSAGAGFFLTIDNPLSSAPVGDRSARLAALLAAEGPDIGTAVQNTTQAATATVIPQPASAPATSPLVTKGVPIRDALSVHEFYQYGDASHQIRASVYDTKVLPFYFWWWIDYNRFVQSAPAAGYSYLVVYTRIENTGNKSAIVPSADQFNLTYNGVSYAHKPFFDTSVLSQWQIDYYSSHYDKLPYQWIRELGQDKRDYAFLMGYNIFNQNLTSNATATAITATPTPTLTNADLIWGSNSVTDMDYLNYNLKPGPSNAMDGYLIYEVPDAAVNDLKNAYMQVSFNGHSSTRWRLG
jgi:phosphate transport system permease protein